MQNRNEMKCHSRKFNQTLIETFISTLFWLTSRLVENIVKVPLLFPRNKKCTCFRVQFTKRFEKMCNTGSLKQKQKDGGGRNWSKGNERYFSHYGSWLVGRCSMFYLNKILFRLSNCWERGTSNERELENIIVQKRMKTIRKAIGTLYGRSSDPVKTNWIYWIYFWWPWRRSFWRWMMELTVVNVR